MVTSDCLLASCGLSTFIRLGFHWPMAEKEGDSPLEAEAAKCPVIRAWMDIPILTERAANGKLAEIGKEGLNRESVATNAEMLEPVIKEFGNLA